MIGYHRHVLGLGQALRMNVRALELSKTPYLIRDFNPGIASHSNHLPNGSSEISECRYRINLMGINPDLLYRLPMWFKADEWRTRYNIGYWFWELPHFPKAWAYARHLVDEVWVNTEFVKNAIEESQLPVFKIPFAIDFAMPSEKYSRAYFGIGPNNFVFLFTLDLDSYVERKNPRAVILAFFKAFGKVLGSPLLIIKIVHGERHPNVLHALRTLIDHHPRIRVINEPYSGEQLRGLLRSADCYVSLHRAEGLGLAMAESMYLGKPVIATAYSGNMEFMNADNAVLIPYRLIPVLSGQYPHAKHQHWAEPDIEEAARAMQMIVANPEWRVALGQQARTTMLQNYSLVRVAHAINSRLTAIQGGLA